MLHDFPFVFSRRDKQQLISNLSRNYFTLTKEGKEGLACPSKKKKKKKKRGGKKKLDAP